MKHTLPTLVFVSLALTACQPDQPRRQLPQDDRPGGSSQDEAVSDEVQPVRYQVFNREEVDAPPRATIHLLVDAQANQDELRVTLAQALARTSEGDSALVALRAVGYVGRPSGRGPREADLVPIAWAEWLPPSGWYDATEEDRGALHRVYFYYGGPPAWGSETDEGTGNRS